MTPEMRAPGDDGDRRVVDSARYEGPRATLQAGLHLCGPFTILTGEQTGPVSRDPTHRQQAHCATLAILCGRTVASITSQARTMSGSKHPQSKAGAGRTVIDNAQSLSRSTLLDKLKI